MSFVCQLGILLANKDGKRFMPNKSSSKEP